MPFEELIVFIRLRFYICIVHLDTIRVYYSPTNAQVIVLKTILKFTLKQPRRASVQAHHPEGAHYPCSLKSVTQILYAQQVT